METNRTWRSAVSFPLVKPALMRTSTKAKDDLSECWDWKLKQIWIKWLDIVVLTVRNVKLALPQLRMMTKCVKRYLVNGVSCFILTSLHLTKSTVRDAGAMAWNTSSVMNYVKSNHVLPVRGMDLVLNVPKWIHVQNSLLRLVITKMQGTIWNIYFYEYKNK